MQFGRFTMNGIALLLMAAVLGGAVSEALASSEFDIPTSELNKVKKKPLKSETKRKKKSSAKKITAKEQGKPEPEKAKNAPEAEVKTVTAAPIEAMVVSGESREPDLVQIHHSPYSFIVAGKQTVIHAVVSSKQELQKLTCTVKGEEENRPSYPMEKVKGTQYTYSVVLPAMTAKDSAMSYTIAAVDASGKMTRSKEFAIPITDSPVVPSWQIDTPEKPADIKQP